MTGSRPLKLVEFDDVQRTDAALEELASRRGEGGQFSDPALLILDELIADVDEREPVLRAVGSPGSARRTRRGRRGRFIAALGIGVVIAGGSTGVAVAGSQFFDDLRVPPRVHTPPSGEGGETNGDDPRDIEAGVAPPSGGANAERPPHASRDRPGAQGKRGRPGHGMAGKGQVGVLSGGETGLGTGTDPTNPTPNLGKGQGGTQTAEPTPDPSSSGTPSPTPTPTPTPEPSGTEAMESDTESGGTDSGGTDSGTTGDDPAPEESTSDGSTTDTTASGDTDSGGTSDSAEPDESEADAGSIPATAY